MALSEEKIRGYMMRLLKSRLRLLCTHGFYGLLLMHMIYAISEDVPTAATTGERIIFGMDFLENLSDEELDYVMMHELLHVVLQHCMRNGSRDEERFNIACDIVVNSNILLENGGKLSSITLAKYGVASMHLAPDGKEGHEYTAEQVYAMLPPSSGRKKKPHINFASGRAMRETDPHDKYLSQQWDDHSKWSIMEDDDTLRDVWVKRIEDACKVLEVQDPQKSRGLIPAFAERLLKELHKPQTDWRTILNEFVQ